MGGRINGWLKRRYRRTYRDGGEVFRFSWNEPERVCHMRWQSARPKIVHFSGVQVRREREGALKNALFPCGSSLGNIFIYTHHTHHEEWVS